MMWDYYGHGAGWESWLMPVFMIVFVAAVVVAIVFLVRYLAQPQTAQTGATVPPQQQAQAQPPQQATVAGTAAETPQDILKRRYALGEIERDEYLQKLGDL